MGEILGYILIQSVNNYHAMENEALSVEFNLILGDLVIRIYASVADYEMEKIHLLLDQNTVHSR